MTDKVQKIKEWISKTQDGLMDANGNFEYPEHEGAFDILSNLDYYIDSLQEEPVSEELEQAAKYNTFKYVFDKNVKETLISELKYIGVNSFKDGAEWQKRKDDELLTTAYIDGVENGKKQALKDIPKWKIFRNTKYAGEMFDSRNVIIVPYHGTTYEIWLQDLLDKLPKED